MSGARAGTGALHLLVLILKFYADQAEAAGILRPYGPKISAHTSHKSAATEAAPPQNSSEMFPVCIGLDNSRRGRTPIFYFTEVCDHVVVVAVTVSPGDLELFLRHAAVRSQISRHSRIGCTSTTTVDPRTSTQGSVCLLAQAPHTQQRVFVLARSHTTPSEEWGA